MKRNMTCACCGEYAGRFEQWWNRDNGYGICPRCAKQEFERDHYEATECYGYPVINFTFDPKELHETSRLLEPGTTTTQEG